MLWEIKTMDNSAKIIKAICEFEAQTEKRLLAQCVKVAKLWNAHDDRSAKAAAAMADQIDLIRGKGKLGYNAFKQRITAGNWVIEGGFTDEQILTANWTISEMSKCFKTDKLKEAKKAGDPIKWEDIETRGAFVRPVVKATPKHAPLSKGAAAVMAAHKSPVGASILQEMDKLYKKTLAPGSCAGHTLEELAEIIAKCKAVAAHVNQEMANKQAANV
jgi:hypothetical protein